MTFAARIFDDFAAAVTGRTRLLHCKEALAHLHLAHTVTGRTLLRLCTFFRPAAVTFITGFQGRNTDLFGHTTNRFFKGQFDVVTQVCSACRALLTATTTKNITEDVTKDITEISTAETAAAKSAATAHTALLKCRVAVLVISRTFLCVGEDLVCFFYFFEFIFRVFIALITVRVIFHRKAFVGFFNLFIIRRFRDAQHLIVIFFCHPFCPLTHRHGRRVSSTPVPVFSD